MTRQTGTLFGRLEAALLIVLGLASVLFARGDRYGVLMNDAFRPITLAGGAFVLLMGLALLVRPRREGRVSALLVLFALFVLVAITRPVRDGMAVLGPDRPPPTALEREGYTIREVTTLFEGFRQETPGLDGQRYIMGGLVKRTPDLDAQGRYVLLDPVMACCLADAIAMGVVVDAAGRPAPRTGSGSTSTASCTQPRRPSRPRR